MGQIKGLSGLKRSRGEKLGHGYKLAWPVKGPGAGSREAGQRGGQPLKVDLAKPAAPEPGRVSQSETGLTGSRNWGLRGLEPIGGIERGRRSAARPF